MKELTTQLKNLLQDRQSILLLSHKKIDGDGLASMIVLKKLLETEGKEVTCYTPTQIPEIYHFLPYIHEVDTTLKSSNDFIISLYSSSAEVDRLRYSVDGDVLNIVVTPKHGSFTAEDISTKQAVGKFDLIIVLDSGDLEHLGEFYEENTDLFYSTPIVNIDHHITNTGFGQLNMVDVTAASTTEIMYGIAQNFVEVPEAFFNEDIATLLLTGLIVDTGSFQHTNTSPKALEFAADLIEMGARQQEIIQNIYKTKQLSTLKLWGRILAKIQEDPILKLVWSTVSKEDLIETGASLDEADGLIDELMTNAPGADIVLLLKDSLEGELSASLRSTSVAVDTLEIAQHFGGGGHKQASGFKQKGNNFNVFVADVIQFSENFQKNRLGLVDEEIDSMRDALKNKQASLKNQGKQMNIEEFHPVQEKRDILSEMIATDQGDIHGKSYTEIVPVKKQEEEKEVKPFVAPIQGEVKFESKKKSMNNDQSTMINDQSREIVQQRNSTTEQQRNREIENRSSLNQQPRSGEQKQVQAQQKPVQKQEVKQFSENPQMLSDSLNGETPEKKKRKKKKKKKPVDNDQSTMINDQSREIVQQRNGTTEQQRNREIENRSQIRQVQQAPVQRQTTSNDQQNIQTQVEQTPVQQQEVYTQPQQVPVQQQMTQGYTQQQSVQNQNVAAYAQEQAVQQQIMNNDQSAMTNDQYNIQAQVQANPVQDQNTSSYVQQTSVQDQNTVSYTQEQPVQQQNVQPQIQQEPVQQQITQDYTQQQSVQNQNAGAYTQEQAVQQQYYQDQQAQAYQQQMQAAQAMQSQPVQQQAQQQQQFTKEQAMQYASYYAQQLQQMNPQTQEYAQVYQYYQYYAQFAQ